MTETTLNFIIWTNYGTNRGIQKVARAEKVKQKGNESTVSVSLSLQSFLKLRYVFRGDILIKLNYKFTNLNMR